MFLDFPYCLFLRILLFSFRFHKSSFKIDVLNSAKVENITAGVLTLSEGIT